MEWNNPVKNNYSVVQTMKESGFKWMRKCIFASNTEIDIFLSTHNDYVLLVMAMEVCKK